jgi:hypothetical protein
MFNFRLAVSTHFKHSAVSCRYANIYHHNRTKLIKHILCRQTIGAGAKFMPQSNHQAVCHKGHKYMSLYPLLELMIYRTNGKVAFEVPECSFNLCKQDISLPDNIRLCFGKIGSQQIHTIPQKYLSVSIPVEAITEILRCNCAA